MTQTEDLKKLYLIKQFYVGHNDTERWNWIFNNKSVIVFGIVIKGKAHFLTIFSYFGKMAICGVFGRKPTCNKRCV